jgi:hypothetical protein
VIETNLEQGGKRIVAVGHSASLSHIVYRLTSTKETIASLENTHKLARKKKNKNHY